MIDIFNQSNGAIKLNPPYEVIIPKLILDKLYSRYAGRTEKGGFVAGKIDISNKIPRIHLKILYPVQNMLKGKEAYDNYFPNVKNVNRIYKMLTNRFPEYIPFHYHTHPQASFFEMIQDPKSTLLDVIYAVLSQQPTMGDFTEIHGIWSSFYEKEFLIPEILITKNIEGTPLIFFYGKGTEYELPSPAEIARRITTKAEIGRILFKDIYNEFFPKIMNLWDSTFLNKILIGGGLFLTSGILLNLIIQYPMAFFNLILGFGLLFLNQDTLVTLDNPVLADPSQKEIRVKINPDTLKE